MWRRKALGYIVQDFFAPGYYIVYFYYSSFRYVMLWPIPLIAFHNKSEFNKSRQIFQRYKGCACLKNVEVLCCCYFIIIFLIYCVGFTPLSSIRFTPTTTVSVSQCGCFFACWLMSWCSCEGAYSFCYRCFFCPWATPSSPASRTTQSLRGKQIHSTASSNSLYQIVENLLTSRHSQHQGEQGLVHYVFWYLSEEACH